MVLRAALLIIVAGFLAMPSSAGAGEPSCLQCHPGHYRSTGTCLSCHRGDPRSSRRAVAHRNLVPGRFSHYALPDSPVLKRGRRHVKTAGCRRCHLIRGRGNHLAADLDKVVNRIPPGQVFQAIRRPALFMPDFHFSRVQVIELINALLAAGSKKDSQGEEIPRLIFFAEGQEQEGRNIFSRRCGECHRLLSPVLGSVGGGRTGPNLSGLLTGFYPRFSYDRKRWSEKIVRKWLNNPRDLRPRALMPPVDLKQRELDELLEIIQADAVRKR